MTIFLAFPQQRNLIYSSVNWIQFESDHHRCVFMFCSVSLCVHERVCVCVRVGGEKEAVIHPHFGIQFETEIFLGRGAGW